MAIYGNITRYGTDVYGLSLPSAYLVEPFAAQSVNYGTIQVTWAKPTGFTYRFRLISNRWGFPVNENDGDIIVDSAAYPGNSYMDTQVIAGTYHYYGIYVLVDIMNNTWMRAGVTACLANQDKGSAALLWNRLPEFYKLNLPGDASGNSYLQQFLGVLGWSVDYLRTQYDTQAASLNNPLTMPINDLWNMARQFGLNISPQMPAHTLRKAVLNAAHVDRERGTRLGLANEIALSTGWGADIQYGPNLLLSNDQAQFLSPVFLPWTGGRYYAAGEIVWSGTPSVGQGWTGTGSWYQCVTSCQGIPPAAGTSTTTVAVHTAPGMSGIIGAPVNYTSTIVTVAATGGTAYWALILDADDFLATLRDARTSNPSTWEAIDTTQVNGAPAPGTLTQGLGVSNIPGTGYAWNALRVTNPGTVASTMITRSVSRTTADLSAIPDPGFEAGTTVINNISVASPTWVPRSWPVIPVIIPGFPGQRHAREQYNQSAYWTGTKCQVTRVKGGSHSGTWHAVLTPATAGGSIRADSPWLYCLAGSSVQASLWVRAPSALSVPVFIQVVWRDQHGAWLSSTATTPQTLPAGVQTKLSLSGLSAPAGTVYASLELLLADGALLTDVVHFDDALVLVNLGLNPNFGATQMAAIESAVPVPWARDSQAWSALKRYATQDIVLYQGQPFRALRASTGAAPPTNSVASAEWAPLSESRRIRLAVSGYTSQNMFDPANNQVPVIPGIEWYDVHGKFITRTMSRNAFTGGAAGKPGGLVYDSFTGFSRVAVTTGSASAVLPPWQASFWQNETMTGLPALTRTDPLVNFTGPSAWTGRQPCQSIGLSGWSARWLTSFTPSATGQYTFTMSSLGGSRMIVNGKVVIDNWTASSAATLTAVVLLSGGTRASIEVDYYNANQGPGSWTPNLLPDSWVPGGTRTVTHTTAPFPVVALQNFDLELYVATWPTTIKAQVNWYENSTLIGTTGLKTSTSGSLSVRNDPHTYVPANANFATVYIYISGSRGGYTQSFQLQLSAPTPAALAVGSPVPYTVTTGTQATSTVTGRTTDDEQAAWVTPVGQFAVGGYLGGTAWQQSPGTRSIAVIPGQSPNCQVAVTLRDRPTGVQNQGIVFRYKDPLNYWRCDRYGLWQVNTGGWSMLTAHSVPFSTSDRMTVVLNGNSIQVLRNGVQVSVFTSSFNSTYGSHGVVIE